MIVVGARCAGSPLAMMLSQAGLKVCLVDRAGFPSDTPSTHGIQPSGVKILDRLGVLERILEAAPAIDDGVLAFDGVRAEFAGITESVGAPMVNIRRVTLDAILLDAAVAAGVEARTGTTVTGLVGSAGRVVGVETTGGTLRAPLVVGADGARSTVARLVGAREYHRTAPRRIFLWSYLEGVDPAERRVWLGNIGGDGFLASPTDAGLFLAAIVVPVERRAELRGNRQAGLEEGLSRWPELAERIAGARQVGPVRMMSRWHGYFRQSAGPGWVLVGDAGHFKDPTRGRGSPMPCARPRPWSRPWSARSVAARLPIRRCVSGGPGATATPGRCTGSRRTWGKPGARRSCCGLSRSVSPSIRRWSVTSCASSVTSLPRRSCSRLR